MNNEDTYEEWFRNELSYPVEDFTVASKRPTNKDIKRVIAGLGPLLSQKSYQKLFGLGDSDAKEIWDACSSDMCFSGLSISPGDQLSFVRNVGQTWS